MSLHGARTAGWSAVTLLLCGGWLSLAAPGCSKHKAGGGDKHTEGTPDKGSSSSTGLDIISIDGSSTVFPITEAVAEEFRKSHKTRVTIGVSGTGGGFKKFCSKETSVTGASRPIRPSEVELCGQNGVDYIELPVAYDGIAIVVNPKADWLTHVTVEELQRLWRPEAQKKLVRWSQLRPGLPDKEIRLFGPGVDSGTYDYFTKAIVGKEHASRGDFTSSEDDNVLVQGVATDEHALGYFGFAYYAENKERLKIVPVDDGKADNGDGPITPSLQTVGNGTYQPLSRPIFIYVSKTAAASPKVQEFIAFYFEHGSGLVQEVGYIPLPKNAYQLVQKRFEERVTGSLFAGKGSRVGVTVEQLLADK